MLPPEPKSAVSQVRAPATYELVVEQIRRALALGRFAPGDKLPPERDLATQLGVSRTSVREAIRTLEGQGVLSVRRGSTGGVTVCEGPPLHQLTAAERKRQRQTLEWIVDFRLANECAAARLAALHRTEADVARIRELMEALRANEQLDAPDDPVALEKQTTRFAKLDTDFHLAIARASHNPYVLDAVETGRINMLRPVGGVFTRLHAGVNYQHAEIAEAICEKRPDDAAAAMHAHIEATREQLKELVSPPRVTRRRRSPSTSPR